MELIGDALLRSLEKQEKIVLGKCDFVLEGTCDCTEQQVIITVEKDYCFAGQFDIIVLDRIEK